MRPRLLLLLAATALPALATPPQTVEHARMILEDRAPHLGLDSRHRFQVRGVHQDALLGEHDVRMVQHFKGVRVMGGEAIVHMLAGGTRKVTESLLRNLDLDVNPSLGAHEALAVAHATLAPRGAYVTQPQVELVIAPVETTFEDFRGRTRTRTVTRLAFHVHTELENGREETAHTDFLVDAHSGEVLDRWSSLMTANATGSGKSQYSGTVSLNTNSVASGFELNDVVRSSGNKTYNLNHATSGTGTIYTDADNTWGDGANYVEGSSTTAANGQTAAVDAAYGLQVTWDMYKNVFGRNGIDALGTATYSRVHYSNSYDNAFWSDTCFCMTYGDGSSFQTLTSLDVAGHEMSHGVCSRTANLTYRGESGGLNEANSDIFGTLAEFYARANNATGTTIGDTGGNWTIGEQLATPSFNKPLRYMYKPSLDGSSPDAWSSTLKRLDVHYSSGPANHFFFLLSAGAANTSVSPMANGVTSIVGLGNQKAGQIWYRALTKYMTSSTTYAGARTATLSAAADLFGSTSAEYATVNKAWLAVNVK